MLSIRISLLVLTAISTGLALAGPATEAARSEHFGRQWVRSHPFTLMALTLRNKAVSDNDWYSQAGLNTMLAWKHRPAVFEAAVRQGIPWHYHVNKRKKQLTDELQSELRSLMETYPGGQGFLVWDEPELPWMPAAAKMVAGIKRMFPDALVYSNAKPINPMRAYVYSMPGRAGARYLGDGILDDTPVPYTYDDYLDDFVRIIKPDVLMADVYPFWEPKKVDPTWYLREKYFWMLAAIRKAGLKHDLPYWVFVQSYEDKGRCRLPSESDVRMQVYSSLAFGFTGIAYFVYDWGQDGERSLLDEKFLRTRLYHDVAKLNREVSSLGKALRFLTSTDLRYIPGAGREGGRWQETTPKGLYPFHPKSRVAKWVRQITIREAKPGKDALIGFFEDDDGGSYFMLVNLTHGKDVSADAAEMSIDLTFAPSLKTLARLSRTTGTPEVIPLKDSRITITLPGGTGDLFKIGGAAFPGLESDQ